MKGDQWLQHFVEVTEKRFDRLDSKIDTLIKFKWQIVGGSVIASLILTIAFQIIITKVL